MSREENKIIWKKAINQLVCIVFIGLMPAACTKVIRDPAWIFEKESIQVHIRADHQLNLYKGKPHTLYICLYQLKSINSFNQLSADPNGIRKLLECKRFDDSVTSAVSKVIHAGEKITLTLDRTEKAQYLAIATGYSDFLYDAGMVRWYRIPVYEKRESWIKNKYRCIPCPLNIELILGQHQIDHSEIIPNEKLECHDECKQQ